MITWYQPGSGAGDKLLPVDPFKSGMRIGDTVEIHPDSQREDRYGTITGFLRIRVLRDRPGIEAALVRLPVENITRRFQLATFKEI